MKNLIELNIPLDSEYRIEAFSRSPFIENQPNFIDRILNRFL